MSKAHIDTATQMAVLAEQVGRLQNRQDERSKELEDARQSLPPSEPTEGSEPSEEDNVQPLQSLGAAVDQHFETLFSDKPKLASASEETQNTRPMSSDDQELTAELASPQAAHLRLESAHEALREDLQRARGESEHNEKLYLLMKSLLERHALLQAARLTATKAPSIDTVKESTGHELTEAKASPNRALATDKEKKIRNAARIARVMVADLFLYSPKLAEQGNSKEEVRKFLKSQYREARKTFESRVPEQLWKEDDFLEIEFERVLAERTGASSTDAESQTTPNQTTPNPNTILSPEEREHKNAARVASVAVEDLFLYQRETESAGISEDRAHRVLMSRYQEASKTFRSRVPERVWEKTDYLEIEFEKALAERATSKASGDDSAPAEETQAAEAVGSASDDSTHEAAARVARLMVADLFLDNWTLVEKGIRGDNLREVINAKYQEACRCFESCVAQSVWAETHYFERQFDQVLWESCGALVTGKVEQGLRKQLDAMTAESAVASEAARV